MPRLFEIVYKAVWYTRSHKFLWFFGFFLTWAGAWNFVRFVDLNNLDWQKQISAILTYIVEQPYLSFAIFLLILIFSFIGLTLGAMARSSLIYATLHLERKEEISFRLVLKNTAKHWWRILGIGVLISIVMLLLFIWVAIPTYYIFTHGYVFRGILVTTIGLAIFAPLFIALSLINIFAACFVVIYEFKLWDAIKNAADLFSRYWDRTIGLLIVLSFIYIVLFLFSASVLSLIGVLAYMVSNMLQSIAVHFYFGLMSIVVTLLTIVLLTVNAILNVFTNIAWTLFFLKIVKAKRYP